MIRIQEHIDDPNPESYLDNLALSLWISLNPKFKTKNDYKSNSLIEKCKKYRNQTQSSEYRKKYANNDVNEAKRHKAFFNFLLASKAAKLKRIIISRPTEFAAIETEIFTLLNRSDLFTVVSGSNLQTPFGKLLSETIFNYKAFRGSDFCSRLLTDIGFGSTTCPYCNDNKLKIVSVNSTSTPATKSRAYLDLDHFYPKSQHPFFAVSFFNLVPSCHDCNSLDKADKPFAIDTHIHPYCEAFDDFYKFKISLIALLGDPVDKIEIEKLVGKPIDRTLDDLNLVARYNNHLDQVRDLVTYFNNHKHLIGSFDEAAFVDAIFRLNGGIPQNSRNILKCQRGKMSRDTLKQIDISNVLRLT